MIAVSVYWSSNPGDSVAGASDWRPADSLERAPAPAPIENAEKKAAAGGVAPIENAEKTVEDWPKKKRGENWPKGFRGALPPEGGTPPVSGQSVPVSRPLATEAVALAPAPRPPSAATNIAQIFYAGRYPRRNMFCGRNAELVGSRMWSGEGGKQQVGRGGEQRRLWRAREGGLERTCDLNELDAKFGKRDCQERPPQSHSSGMSEFIPTTCSWEDFKRRWLLARRGDSACGSNAVNAADGSDRAEQCHGPAPRGIWQLRGIWLRGIWSRGRPREAGHGAPRLLHRRRVS